MGSKGAARGAARTGEQKRDSQPALTAAVVGIFHAYTEGVSVCLCVCVSVCLCCFIFFYFFYFY